MCFSLEFPIEKHYAQEWKVLQFRLHASLVATPGLLITPWAGELLRSTSNASEAQVSNATMGKLCGERFPVRSMRVCFARRVHNSIAFTEGTVASLRCTAVLWNR